MVEEEGQTKDVHPVDGPHAQLSSFVRYKDNIQKHRLSEASFYHLFGGFGGKYPPPPRHLVFSADAALGFTQELQKTALLNILHLFHRATVGYSSRSRR